MNHIDSDEWLDQQAEVYRTMLDDFHADMNAAVEWGCETAPVDYCWPTCEACLAHLESTPT